MPPKKKRPTPIVVGTVSTRSTRRESIVNIEIIPKAIKSTKSPTPKKTTKAGLKPTQSEQYNVIEVVHSSEETRPEILEILKDWSDDEYSQDDNIFPVHRSSRSSHSQLANDQQSLIDILEGKQSPPLQKTDFKSINTSATSKSVNRGKDHLVENPVVDIDSPKVEEPDIIEECVVEDDSIIIELSEEHFVECMNTKDGTNTNFENKRIIGQGSAIVSRESSHNINQTLRGTSEADEDIGSLSSEDTSQSIVTLQGESTRDNDIHISDNSTNNYEIVEEQVICDNSEHIIINSFGNILAEENSKQSDKLLKSHDNEKINIEGHMISSRYLQQPMQGSSTSLEHRRESTLTHTKVMYKSQLVVDEGEYAVSSKLKEEPHNKKSEIDGLKSDGSTLYLKINESMQISDTSIKNSHIDSTSDKLQEGFSKISIKSEKEICENYLPSDFNYEKKGTSYMSSNVNAKMEFREKMDASKIDSGIPPRNKKIKKLFDSDSDVSPKISPRASPKIKMLGKAGNEPDSKQFRRSTRKKPSDLEVASTHVIRENSDLDNSLSSESECRSLSKKNNIETYSINADLEMATQNLGEVKLSKTKMKKGQQRLSPDGRKMDIDFENSEIKSSETEGDSTSNDSNHDQANSKVHKIKKKDLENISSESPLAFEMSTCERDNLMTAIEMNANRRSPKGNKLKSKKEDIQDSDEQINKMDVEQDSIKILRSEIDATIDEVLRKYTCEESDSDKDHIRSKYSKKKKDTKPKRDEKNGESSEEVRRSDRIKTILPVKKKSHGLVRSKSEPFLSLDAESSDSNSVHNDFDKPTPSASPLLNKTEKSKVKSKSSENLQLVSEPQSVNSPELPKPIDIKADKSNSQAEIEARLKTFIHLKENQYRTDRQVCKEAKGMICDCYLAEEDIQNDEYGCGEDCLNRLLMIECGELCQVEDRCTNKRFQKSLFAPVEVFKTEKKGLGLRAAANIAYGEFILEYVGEVLNPNEFDKRAEVYSKDKNIHFYFMSLRADAIIDATMKGNISRFINHSCDPNAETQKWTVNGELRIGFFSTRTILAGEEITFDYRFQRYGKEAQRCYCEATTCRGWLGERPDESEDEDEEEEEESSKVSIESGKADTKISPEILKAQLAGVKIGTQDILLPEKTDIEESTDISLDVTSKKITATQEIQEMPKKVTKKKPRKETLYEDFDQLNEDIEMLVTTGLKNQAHTLKMSRLMVRAKDLDQRKKLLRVLRRGELPCRRLFLDYHGLRLMHGYMIEAQQLTSRDAKVLSSELEIIQTKLELLQTLAVLPIQNKTMLIESKVLPAVEKWAKNEDLVEDSDQKDVKKSPPGEPFKIDILDPTLNEKIDEIKFLATKLLEEWVNLKESFRIPKKQRIEQMKEHEKEANRKFMESSYAQEKESSRKHDQRYRSWSRCKSEREISKKAPRQDDKDRPSAEFLKISRHERRKLFALQMELKEEERRLKQRELWRQHEINCLLIGADPRFTAPFDPSKGFQYIWNPSLGQWQALPVPAAQGQGVYNSPVTPQGVSNYNLPPHKQPLLGPYAAPMINVPGISGTAPQFAGLQPTLPSMVPGLATSGPGMANPVHGLPGIAGSLPGIAQHPLPSLPMYQEVKQDDPLQVTFAGPIPPPAKLPPKWKCAKDKYGRPYYYHVKIRKSQWEPPPLSEPIDESSESSSSETSSGSSSESSSDSDTDDEIDDSKLLLEVRKQMESTSKIGLKPIISDHIKKESDSVTPSPEMKVESDNDEEVILPSKDENNSEQLSSIDIRLKEQFNLDSGDPPKKKRRLGLCQEIIISPRTEEDRKQFKEDLKRYRATKEKLKRQKEQMMLQAKKKLKISGEDVKRSRDKRSKGTVKSRIKEMKEWNDENAKKIKETFRSTMATTVVGVLNAYRKPECKEARITNTEDFKHLARKLTHFVMLKEMKHLSCIEELICTDNVKAKAREYIRKYMSKFGEVYQKRHDEPDFKD